MVKTFLLPLAPTCNGVYRTCLLTPSATDTFRTVGVFHRVDHHLASLCTFSTVNAFIFIHAVPEYGNRIKGRIKGPKRTDISAKWTINNDSKNNRNDQNSILPYIKSSHRTAHGFIQQDQRNAAFQCACRTDQFAEIRSTLTHDIYYEHGEQDNEYEKDHVFQSAEQFVPFKCADFIWERNLIQQILDQTERA